MPEKSTPFLHKILKNLGKSIDSQEKAKDFEKAEKYIQEIRQSQKDFVSYVTHELMAPVSSIHKHSYSLLLDKKLGDSHRHNVAQIHDNIVKLEDLLSAYLKFDPSKSKKIDINLEPLDINEIIAELIADFDKHHPKRISFNTKKISKIFADKEKVKEILNHILDNAVRYSKGKIKLDIKLGKGRYARDIIISVKDDGIGIPEKEKTKVFEGFYRASNNFIKSSGLGLYISRTLTKKHNGEIWFESTENKGTTFYIALPIAK